jgi:hypothetical protein
MTTLTPETFLCGTRTDAESAHTVSIDPPGSRGRESPRFAMKNPETEK